MPAKHGALRAEVSQPTAGSAQRAQLRSRIGRPAAIAIHPGVRAWITPDELNVHMVSRLCSRTEARASTLARTARLDDSRFARPARACAGLCLRASILALALGLGCAPKLAPATTPKAALDPPSAGLVETEADAEAEESNVNRQDADADLPPANGPGEVAQRWLEALRRASPSLLGVWSRYPFMLHDTGSEGTCGHGAAADAKQLGQLLSCMLGNRALLEELRRSPDATPTALSAKDLPAWARRWRNEAPADASLILFEIMGHGNASHFLLVVHDGGVSALWKETLFDMQ